SELRSPAGRSGRGAEHPGRTQPVNDRRDMTRRKTPRPRAPAGIEYLGVAGSSQDCQEAVIRRVQYGERIHQARILSSAGTHCLLLANGIGDQAAVKSGSASGYGGGGAAALA